MLKNMKIRTKMILAFGSIVLIATVIIIILLVSMGSIAGMTSELYERPYKASNYMWSLRRNFIDIEKELYKMVILEDKDIISSSQKNITSDSESVYEAIEGLSNFQEQRKKDVFEDIKIKISDITSIRENIINLCAKGNFEEARKVILSSYEPKFKEVNDLILKLAEMVSNDAVNFVDESIYISRISVTFGIILLAVGFIAAFFIVKYNIKLFVRPILQLKNVADEMSKGNLKIVDSITYVSKDEVGELAESLKVTIITLSSYVGEVSKILYKISHGDLTTKSEDIIDFFGDFKSIKDSLIQILENLNGTLNEINISAESVEAGASQISDTAQGISQGASEQAVSLEQLSSTIEKISEETSYNAKNAESATKIANQANSKIETSSRKMNEMLIAMAEINNFSNEIRKIISTIEDISFQTNILALNATIEAAHAGSLGKGFAVVADEVRTLAGKSSEAAKSTALLIEDSIQSIENGTKIANETAEALSAVVDSTLMVINSVGEIAKASENQSVSVAQVTQGVEQISSVVQMNSASAEESAASAEELASQASILNSLVRKFSLLKR